MGHWTAVGPLGENAIERVLVCVEGHRRRRLVDGRRLLSDHNEDFPWDDRQGSKAPGRVAQERPVPFRDWKEELHAFRPLERDARRPVSRSSQYDWFSALRIGR